VNNVLAVLGVLLKKAVEWAVIERVPCSIRLLAIPKPSASFHDFDDYERLVEAAGTADPQAHLIVLLGGPFSGKNVIPSTGGVVVVSAPIVMWPASGSSPRGEP